MVSKEQRRRQLARAKFERQQQRRANRARRGRRRQVLLVALLVALLAGGGTAWAVLSGGDDEGSQQAADDEATADPGEETSPPVEDPCEEPAEGEPSTQTWEEEPEMAVDTASDYLMRLRTTCGDIGITMDAEVAPRTVNSFNFLAGEGFFDHSRCHRLVPEGIFVLQCGDPEGTGAGGPGYTIPDENLDDPDVAEGVYPAGTVAMANQYNPQDDSGRDSGGSQFFIVYDDSQLPPDYTPFGTVTEGLDVVQLIAETGATQPDPTTGNTAPHATVVINEATVEEVAAE
ncbi:peptidylprolyl isomerase [Streptomyces sp. MP131-18]|uniref:peptidylprolyl isomerase n=1 Tax=Streptomyces sp. MP131-18 TaxID=1857892 RepID=UPI00097CA265|nr:peptidylprolyl isomerase [Streptomyces sp. MP131-18]ONK15713.1 putative bifunctional phosphatase/peptidyl-prolyl cis-trans isomerase [Streptomyces sp. MP131-18]